MKHFCVFALVLFVMPLLGQTPAPAKPAPQAQTILLGSNGGLYVFNQKHELVAHCDKISGKTVESCSIEKGFTVNDVIQGLLDTLVPVQKQ